MRLFEIAQKLQIDDEQFENYLYEWFGAQDARARDMFLLYNIPDRYKTLPPSIKKLYRYIDLPWDKIETLILKQKPIISKYTHEEEIEENLTSSWSPLNLGKNSTAVYGNRYGRVVLSKPVRNQDVVLYAPSLSRYHPKFVREMDNTARDAILYEREVIIKNNNYWDTIKPEEIISIENLSQKQFFNNLDDYFPR